MPSPTAARGWRLWAAALLVETTAPAFGFWVPGLGRSTTEDWDVEGGHMAERCGLFVIIALGESILVTGAKFASLTWTPTTVAAFVVAFVGSVAMWWIYFNVGAERASRNIAASSDPGRIARLSYTYLHLPLVAGIIVAAVGDELVLSHPTGPHGCQDCGRAAGGAGAVSGGQPAVQARERQQPSAVAYDRARPAGAGGAGWRWSSNPVTFSAATTLVLVLVAVWETLSLRTVPAPLVE